MTATASVVGHEGAPWLRALAQGLRGFLARVPAVLPPTSGRFGVELSSGSGV